MQKDGFERLYKSRFATIVSFFMRRGFSIEEANDLSQDTFLRVYELMERVENPEAYLRTAAANVWKNDLRSRSTHKRRAVVLPIEGPADAEGNVREYLPPDGSPSPFDDAQGTERQEQMRTAVEGLPSRMRACLLLRSSQEMSYAQIAKVMQVSKGTVKSQLHQARRRLAEELGDVYSWIGVDDESDLP